MLKIGFINPDTEIINSFKELERVKFIKVIGFINQNSEVSEKLLKKINLPVFSNIDELFEQTDALIINNHENDKDLVLQVLKKSKHLYLKNYLDISSECIDEIIKIAREANVTVKIEQSVKYHPFYKEIIGKINQAEFIEIRKEYQQSKCNFQSINIMSDIDIILNFINSNKKRIINQFVNVFNSNFPDVIYSSIEFENGSFASLLIKNNSSNCIHTANFFERNTQVEVNLLENKYIHTTSTDRKNYNYKGNNIIIDLLTDFNNSIQHTSCYLTDLEQNKKISIMYNSLIDKAKRNS